jgi:hypothetical protein
LLAGKCPRTGEYQGVEEGEENETYSYNTWFPVEIIGALPILILFRKLFRPMNID